MRHVHEAVRSLMRVSFEFNPRSVLLQFELRNCRPRARLMAAWLTPGMRWSPTTIDGTPRPFIALNAVRAFADLVTSYSVKRMPFWLT